MTPAIAELDAAGVAHVVIEYDHDPQVTDYGREAAAKSDLDPTQVFKTLLVTARNGDGRSLYAVGIVPVVGMLSLKHLGRALGMKRVSMCDPADAERLTGYVVGGISPFGQRTRLPTVIDELAMIHERIFVSGGRRGLEIGLAPADLVAVLGATVDDIAT